MSVPITLKTPYEMLAGAGSNAPRKPEPRFRYWHDALVNLILQNPAATATELGAALGKNPVTVGMVMRSDGFKALMALRRQDHNELVSYSIIAKTHNITEKVLVQLNEKLDDNSVTKKMSGRDLHEIAADMLDRIGISKPQAPVTIHNSIQQNSTTVSVDPEALARARLRLRDNEAVLVSEAPRSLADQVIPVQAPAEPILEELMTLGDEAVSPNSGEREE